MKVYLIKMFIVVIIKDEIATTIDEVPVTLEEFIFALLAST